MNFLCEVCNHAWKTVSGSIKNAETGCPKYSAKMAGIKNTQYNKQAIFKLREQGMYYREIAEKFGCAISTVCYACTQYVV